MPEIIDIPFTDCPDCKTRSPWRPMWCIWCGHVFSKH